MKWVVIILIVLAVALVAGLVWSSMQRKKQHVARERAGEIRSEAAVSGADRQQEEARAREVEAEAQRARAEADRLDAEAQKQRTSYDQTRAEHEDRVREADRIDPDVDHRSADYQPDVHGSTTQEEHVGDGPTVTHGTTGHDTTGQHTTGHETTDFETTGPAGPGPVDPQTGEPLDANDPRRDEL